MGKLVFPRFRQSSNAALAQAQYSTANQTRAHLHKYICLKCQVIKTGCLSLRDKERLVSCKTFLKEVREAASSSHSDKPLANYPVTAYQLRASHIAPVCYSSLPPKPLCQQPVISLMIRAAPDQSWHFTSAGCDWDSVRESDLRSV